MKKNKFKSLGFFSMALLMACTCILALNAISTTTLAHEESTTTSSLGLDPKNDPIIHTTESDLEIQYGGLDIEGTLKNGRLTGYPYFTMGEYNNEPVRWVIIGRNSGLTNVNCLSKDIKEVHLFEQWQAKTQLTFSKYFKNNYLDSTSPAGNKIYQIIQNKCYVIDDGYINMLIDTIAPSGELNSGCVLAISENFLGSTVFDAGNSYIYTDSEAQVYCEDLWATSLNLSDYEKNTFIQPQNLYTRYYNGRDQYYYTNNQHLFILSSYGNENFKYYTYLSAYQLIMSSSYWTRTGGGPPTVHLVESDGQIAVNEAGYVTMTLPIRSACVVKLG